MKLILYVSVAVALVFSVSAAEQEQRILRRVIKSTPTASHLTRVRLISVRGAPVQEKGAVAEISSKEAASFGQRSINETTTNQHVPQTNATKTKSTTSTQATTTTTTTTNSPADTSTSITTSTTSSTSTEKPKLSERIQNSQEVELLSGSPSSWQTMTAVEAPVALLIAAGTRAAPRDLSSSSSTLHSTEESAEETNKEDFLRSSSATKGGSLSSYTQQTTGEAFSRLRQQQNRQQHQQTFFYPQQQQVRPVSKTSNYQATKTHWYQPPSTTPRPAPLIQQQEQYEQQNEQYVEQQQQQVEYGPAPLGQAEPFAFDFKTLDNSGNGQYRREESDKNGVVHGSYGYTDANGIYRHVEYIADQDGFRAKIKSNEPGLIGETQPASIQLARGSGSPQTVSQRFSASTDNGLDWSSEVSHNQGPSSSSADLALAPPNFESIHKPERIRSASSRHY